MLRKPSGTQPAITDAQRPEAQMTVLIACDHDETLLRLRDYLVSAGVRAHATRDLDEALERRSREDALVLFPDDFDTGRVTDGLSRLLSLSRDTLVIVVTADSVAFDELIESTGNDRAVVMPKPVWGWTILDILRAAAKDEHDRRVPVVRRDDP